VKSSVGRSSAIILYSSTCVLEVLLYEIQRRISSIFPLLAVDFLQYSGIVFFGGLFLNTYAYQVGPIIYQKAVDKGVNEKNIQAITHFQVWL
jgi:hypothetical protein